MPDRAVVTLDIGVLLRLARLDMGGDDVSFPGPCQKCATDVFRAIIHPICIRLPASFDGPVERREIGAVGTGDCRVALFVRF